MQKIWLNSVQYIMNKPATGTMINKYSGPAYTLDQEDIQQLCSLDSLYKHIFAKIKYILCLSENEMCFFFEASGYNMLYFCQSIFKNGYWESLHPANDYFDSYRVHVSFLWFLQKMKVL